jgi:hypothetical protein
VLHLHQQRPPRAHLHLPGGRAGARGSGFRIYRVQGIGFRVHG